MQLNDSKTNQHVILLVHDIRTIEGNADVLLNACKDIDLAEN